jgi:glycosyltransferase involved in cell wall biosynthesis
MPLPIRIAHVVQQLDTGGMERLLVEFARHADRASFEPCFVAIGPSGAVAEELAACGWDVTALAEPPGLRPTIVYRLARLFHDRRVDVVHTHNTKPLLYAGPAARLAGVRGVVHTRHGRRHGASRRQALAFRWAARCADHVVGVSDDTGRLCRGEGVDPRVVRTVPNGIDLERFPVAGPDPSGPAVFVGRLVADKGVATLLRAARAVAAVRPAFRLAIAGAGPCEAELRGLAADLGIAGGVVDFLGEVRDVSGLLGRASLFVLPSLTEGMPLTVLEAMARGLPVVATSVGGTPEAVADGETGLLVPPGDATALAGALLRVHADPEGARRMGLAGRRRAEVRFDVRRMVSEYEALYRDALGCRRAAAA